MSGRNTVVIKNMVIGEGRPKICVPVLGAGKDEILSSAREALLHNPDILEWRGDFYEEIRNPEAVLQTLEELRNITGEIPLLFTFRSLREGGEQEISPLYYKELNDTVSRTGLVDLVDIELFSEESGTLVEMVHSNQVKVIVSSHDFQKTPANEEMLSRLKEMEHTGADIVKIAVMPASAKDVLRLLEITLEAGEQEITCPVVTMSMSGKGLISRAAGEVFGSALTFATGGKVSAPGQIPAEELSAILDTIHKNI